MDCPDKELLSAYIDRETSPSEERTIHLHLADCSSCRQSLRMLGRLKVAVRAQPLPSMPSDLRTSLEDLAASAQARLPLGWRERCAAWLERVERHRRWAYAAAAACAGLVGFMVWQRETRTVVPVEVILAAHNQYALTMPLASKERIMSDLPVQITYGGVEESGHVY